MEQYFEPTANWIVKAGYLYECSNCKNAWDDELYGVSILDRCPACGALIDKTKTIWLSDIKEENTQDKTEDAMIRAGNKAVITSHQLLDVFVQKGVMGVYHLGMKHMYEYLEDK